MIKFLVLFLVFLAYSNISLVIISVLFLNVCLRFNLIKLLVQLLCVAGVVKARNFPGATIEDMQHNLMSILERNLSFDSSCWNK